MRQKGLWKVPLLPEVVSSVSPLCSLLFQNSTCFPDQAAHILLMHLCRQVRPTQVKYSTKTLLKAFPLFLSYNDDEIQCFGKVIARDVLYGWCRRCRESHNADYKKIEGWDNIIFASFSKVNTITNILLDQCHHFNVYFDDFIGSRQQCTYCGGDVEDTFSTSGILAACFLFPIGHFCNAFFCFQFCMGAVIP